MDLSSISRRIARLIALRGAPVTLSRTVPGDYDPESDTFATATATAISDALALDYHLSLVDGSLLLPGDKRLLIAAHGCELTPEPGDAVAFGGREWSVVAATSLTPDGTTALIFDCQVRGAGNGGGDS